MARRMTRKPPQDYTVQYVRGILVYLCIVSLFGSVILLVQAGMEEKRVRYQISLLIGEKRELMNDIRKLNNRVAEQENFERISILVEKHLPHLGPPQHPAISLPVTGLHQNGVDSENKPALPENNSLFNQMRKKWRSMETHLHDYLNEMVE